ncbi:MAG TPA: hypothetical protein VGG48_12100 [Rhizomicrobium sp.]|jgi:hypothetical protein
MNDFGDIAFACVALLAALLSILVAQRAGRAAREYLAFAAALYGALALADLAAALYPHAALLATAVTLTIAALAPCALLLSLISAFTRPPSAWIATPALLITFAAGLFAALRDMPFVTFAPEAACLCAMLALAARQFRHGRAAALHAMVCAFGLVAASAAFMTGDEGRTGFVLFAAAGLMGAALAGAKPSGEIVEDKRLGDRRGFAIDHRR